jgi:hypothetical protein
MSGCDGYLKKLEIEIEKCAVTHNCVHTESNDFRLLGVKCFGRARTFWDCMPTVTVNFATFSDIGRTKSSCFEFSYMQNVD